MPVHALWGKKGVVHRLFNCLEDWREVAENVSGGPVNCGHFIPEEAPAKTLAEIRRFIRQHPIGG
jgi:haloacetate dehalogenase